MAKKRKIGWRMRLRKELRENRQEQAIRARNSVKQAKKLNKIYKDMTPEEVNEINSIMPQVAAAEVQLNEAGYETTGDPIETMAMYNDEFGDGNPEQSLEGLDYFYGSSNNWDTDNDKTKAGDYAKDIAGTFSDILARFSGNFDENFDKESLDGNEHFLKKLKERFKKIKKDVGLDDTKGNPNGTTELKKDTGSQVMTLILGGFIGWAISKALG